MFVSPDRMQIPSRMSATRERRSLEPILQEPCFHPPPPHPPTPGIERVQEEAPAFYSTPVQFPPTAPGTFSLWNCHTGNHGLWPHPSRRSPLVFLAFESFVIMWKKQKSTIHHHWLCNPSPHPTSITWPMLLQYLWLPFAVSLCAYWRTHVVSSLPAESYLMCCFLTEAYRSPAHIQARLSSAFEVVKEKGLLFFQMCDVSTLSMPTMGFLE